MAEQILSTETAETSLKLKHQFQRLLPEIPDDVTLCHIAPKISWTDFHILSSVSRAWNRDIQSCEVHRARVRAHSTETLILVKGFRFIALFSMTSKKFYTPSLIPSVNRVNSYRCRCVCLDGRLYVLGGLDLDYYSPQFATDTLSVLELVGQAKWQKCSPMPQPLDHFECEILDGKIYVLGDFNRENFALVYDTKLNAWSSIMPSFRRVNRNGLKVLAGELLVQHSELSIYHPHEQQEHLLVLDVYNPTRNDWRRVHTGLVLMDNPQEQQIFVAEGEFYSMTESTIHGIEKRSDTEENKWIELHSFSCAAAFGCLARGIRITSVVAANGELLATFRFQVESGAFGACLLQSKGFGGVNKVIVWEKVRCALDFGDQPSMCLAQL